MNELIITALNRAIRVYKSNAHQPMWGDVVVSCNPDNTKVATYICRHPGCIMLPVKLEEGSGYFFFKVESTMLGNHVYVAWEEDDSMHSLRGLLKELPLCTFKEISDFFDSLTTKHLFS